MAKCDLCDKFCAAHKLEDLRMQYRIDGVSDVCPECRDKINAIKDKLIANISVCVRDAISEMKFNYCGKRPSWWRRLFA